MWNKPITTLDTADRDSLKNNISMRMLGKSWPVFGDGKEYYNSFLNEFKQAAKDRGYKLVDDVKNPSIEIYTDGACKGNPGKGGYGAVILNCGERIELSDGFQLTTNNRMELIAVIMGLSRLPHGSLEREIIVYSDSTYVVNAINKGWLFDWKKNNFKGRKNSDLWEVFLKLYSNHNIKMVWVKVTLEILRMKIAIN